MLIIKYLTRTYRLRRVQGGAEYPWEMMNARKHYRERRGRKPPVVLDGASSGLWFDGWKGRSPPRPGKYADAQRRCEVAEARTWLLETGWRRIGLIDPAEVPGRWPRRRMAKAA